MLCVSLVPQVDGYVDKGGGSPKKAPNCFVLLEHGVEVQKKKDRVSIFLLNLTAVHYVL